MEEEIIKIVTILRSISIKNIFNIVEVAPYLEITKTFSNVKDAQEYIIRSDDIDIILIESDIFTKENSDFLEIKREKFPFIPVISITSFDENSILLSKKSLVKGLNDYIIEPEEGFNNNSHSIKVELIMLLHTYGNEYKTRRKVSLSLKNERPLKKMDLKAIEKIIAKENLIIKKPTPIKAIAIGASTGGPGAIKTILEGLNSLIECPPIFISQHLPPDFVYEFVKNTNYQIKNFKTKVAENGDIAEKNHIYICPGNKYMGVIENYGDMMIKIIDKTNLPDYQPYVDFLFYSVAHLKKAVIGIILTGMGSDGAKGLEKIHSNGGFTIAQDEKSCVIYSMPKAAINLGAVSKQIYLKDIAKSIIRIVAISKYSMENTDDKKINKINI